MQSGNGDNQVHTIQTISEGGSQGEVVDLNSVTEATLNSDGQIILTAEDGHGMRLFFYVPIYMLFESLNWLRNTGKKHLLTFYLCIFINKTL